MIFLIQLGLKKYEFDLCFDIKRNGQHMILVALYVNDRILVTSNKMMLKKGKESLSQRFEMTEMRQLKYFLGVEID